MLLLLISIDSSQTKLQNKRGPGRTISPAILENHTPWDIAMVPLSHKNSLHLLPEMTIKILFKLSEELLPLLSALGIAKFSSMSHMVLAPSTHGEDSVS